MGEAATKPAEMIPGPYLPLQAYYDGVRKGFWTTNDRGGWIEVTEQSLRRLLRACGYTGGKPQDGERLSKQEQKLNEIQTQFDVAYAGPLAGYRSGIAECCGQRILVTSSPNLVTPVPGDWPVLQRYLDSLLYDPHYNQRDYVFAWLKISYEALRAGVRRTGQAMALAGPAGCGKSLLQNLFTVILGGRSAKPYRYMSGNTQFNADLFGAEHLMIEDEHSSTDIRARRAFGSNIKQVTANLVQSCHGKNRTALSLAPFWRLSISLNDEPEAMMVLPPLDSIQDGITDKIILLSAQKAEMPLLTAGNEAWQKFWNTLTAEIPAFLDFLVKWEIPKALCHPRFGVKAWQHPRLLAALDALAPETRLLSLIDEELFTPLYSRHETAKRDKERGVGNPIMLSDYEKAILKDGWKGTAEQLEKQLCRDCSDCRHEARRLLSWPTAMGTYLGRLAHKCAGRVKKARTEKSRDWVIAPPAPLAA